MKLETKRLYLRKWEVDDAEALYALAQDRDVAENCGWKAHKDIEETKMVLQNVLINDYTWVIVKKETEEVVGNISLMPYGTTNCPENEKQAEIGFWIGKPYWGNGYMPEACLEIMKYGFETLQLECIWCCHHSENHKSHRVQEKCGFRYHHTLEHHYQPLLDNYVTSIVNCMTKEEWEGK